MLSGRWSVDIRLGQICLQILAVTLAVVILSVNSMQSCVDVFGVFGVLGHGCRVWYDVATDKCAAVLCG